MAVGLSIRDIASTIPEHGIGQRGGTYRNLTFLDLVRQCKFVQYGLYGFRIQNEMTNLSLVSPS